MEPHPIDPSAQSRIHQIAARGKHRRTLGNRHPKAGWAEIDTARGDQGLGRRQMPSAAQGMSPPQQRALLARYA